MPNAHSLQPRCALQRRTQHQLKALEKERTAWLAKLSPSSMFHRIFNHIPGMNFFAKDKLGRTMFVSNGILQRYQMQEEKRDARSH